jgi:hypothetical protein
VLEVDVDELVEDEFEEVDDLFCRRKRAGRATLEGKGLSERR